MALNLGFRFTIEPRDQTPSSITSTGAAGDLPLPELVKEVILASKPPGSWRTSVESLAQRVTGVSQGYSV